MIQMPMIVRITCSIISFECYIISSFATTVIVPPAIVRAVLAWLKAGSRCILPSSHRIVFRCLFQACSHRTVYPCIELRLSGLAAEQARPRDLPPRHLCFVTPNSTFVAASSIRATMSRNQLFILRPQPISKTERIPMHSTLRR